MGLYLKKSFRAGPVRLNLSKSGLGLSAGVKGARVGCGPRGTYVHAGRNGLYYRKNLSSHPSASKSSGQESGGAGCGTLILIISVGLAAIWLFSNPEILGLVTAIIAITFVIIGTARHFQVQKVQEYKTSLDNAFVKSDFSPGTSDLSPVHHQQQALPRTAFAKRRVILVEKAVYQAVLDRILDDGVITQQEATAIDEIDKLIGLDAETRLQLKKDIFSAAYIEAIEDREITADELSKLSNLLEGLHIPKDSVQKELNVLSDFVASQKLISPLTPLSSEKISAQIQKNETAFYQGRAKVLSKRKSKTSPTGYEYSILRDGAIVITNKRLFITDEGSTNIRFSDIADVDIDIDNTMIQISKSTSSKPVSLEVDRPVYIGRMIDLLSKNPQ